MSTLDELKKQASEITQQQQVTSSSAQTSIDSTEKEQWRKFAPVMKFLKDHFIELAETLNVLDKDTFVDFEINNDLTIKKMKGQNYKITYPNADKEKQFVFEFENVGENPGYCLLPEGPLANSFKKMLGDNQIKCSTSPVAGNKSLKFAINPLVRTKYMFVADLNKETILLTISNYHNIWSQVNSFKKTEITTKLMDEVTLHAMREPNKYNELVGNVISDDMRTSLREKLNAEKTPQQIQDEQKQINEAKAEQAATKEKTIFGRLFKKK
jgi:hypothetical protein